MTIRTASFPVTDTAKGQGTSLLVVAQDAGQAMMERAATCIKGCLSPFMICGNATGTNRLFLT